MRVHNLASELGVSCSSIIEFCSREGIDLSSNFSEVPKEIEHRYREWHNSFHTTPQRNPTDVHGYASEEQSVEETLGIGDHCSKCGKKRSELDFFCAGCLSPLVRIFRYLLLIEIVLFLSSAVLTSLADTGLIIPVFNLTPLFFVSQALIAYYGWLSIHEPRFLVLLALLVGLVTAHLAKIDIFELFQVLAPVYVAIGIIILWASHLRSTGRRVGIQTLWIAIFILLWSLANISSTDQFLQFSVPWQDVRGKIVQILRSYSPWLTLAGLSITLAIQAGFSVSRRGIAVKEDYFPRARIELGSIDGPIQQPLYIVPLVMTVRILGRAICVVYNTFVNVVNISVRCCVFIQQIVLLFLRSIATEISHTASEVGRFVLLSIVRVPIPLMAMMVAVVVVSRSPQLSVTHAFKPSWESAGAVIKATLMLGGSVLVSVICFSRFRPIQVIETYTKDLAVLVGYSIPTLLLCWSGLVFCSKAVRSISGTDLHFRFGPISGLGFGLVVVGVLVLLRNQLISKLRSFQRGSSESASDS